MRPDTLVAHPLPPHAAINDDEGVRMDAREDAKKSGDDDSPGGDRSIPRGTDEHAEPNAQRDEDRAATTRPRSGTRDEDDAEQDL